jgi:hypothetical protein
VDWGTVITGVVGLAGIGGTLLAARMTGKSDAENLRTSISAEDRRARRTEKREIFARFLDASSRAHLAAARYRSHYDPDHPQGELAEEQSAAVVAMNQAHSVLTLTAPQLIMPAAKLMQHIQKYIVGTFDGEPTSQPFPSEYGDDLTLLYKAMLGELEPEPGVTDHGSTAVRRQRLRTFWRRTRIEP